MVKCQVCGYESNENNSFCPKCGAKMDASAADAKTDAFEQAKKQFEQDALVGVNKEKLVYTCTVCGTVNNIDNTVCCKCGKRRPRSEFISAIKSYNDGTNASEELAKLEAEKVEEERKAAEALEAQKAEDEAKNAETVEEPQEEVEETPEEEQKEAAAEAPAAPAFNQMQPTIQPLVIVPYVSMNQPLMQRAPAQLYRYQPYTYAQREQIENNMKAAMQPEGPTPEDLKRIRDNAVRELRRLDDNNPEVVAYRKGKKKVRAAAVFSAIFSAAIIVVLFVMSFLKADSSFVGIEYGKALATCLQNAFGMQISFASASYVYNGAISFVVPAGAIVLAVIALVIFIDSIVRLCTGRAKVKGFVLPLIAFAISIVLFAIMLVESKMGLEGFVDFFAKLGYGYYAVLGSSLILFIIGLCTKKNKKLSK